jgi:hypothetical protein
MPAPATSLVINLPNLGHRSQAEKEMGKIVRVVGDSMAYVKTLSGDAFAFSAEDIQGYHGEPLRDLGVLPGAQVELTRTSFSPAVALILNPSV